MAKLATGFGAGKGQGRQIRIQVFLILIVLILSDDKYFQTTLTNANLRNHWIDNAFKRVCITIQQGLFHHFTARLFSSLNQN